MKPWEFGALTVQEFEKMHAGFIRAEHRARALIKEHAFMVRGAKKGQEGMAIRDINALRQYPVKRWLKSR